MGRQKRESSSVKQRAELFGAEMMRLWMCSRESRGRMSASRAPCTQAWAPLLGRRQNQSLWCTKTPSTAWTSWTRCEGVLCQRQYRGCPVAVFYNTLDWVGGKSCSSCQRSWGQNTWRGKRPRQTAQGGQQRKQPPQQRSTAAAADTDTNGTKRRTLEARVL